MNIVQEFPYRVREVEHTWIPLSDGCRLAARLWLPEGAERSPVPAILEYIPYRKRDRTRERDEPMHHYFAGHGYAAVRVDVRGTGESEGLLVDEYDERELRDGLEVVRWLSSQPWCSGAVGMIGKSWGGFNSLQIASLQPPGLEAVISVCAADDRYSDDAHYMGGCLLNENLKWGSALFTLNALPPDPELVGDGWRERWLERLRNSTLFPETWLRHQRRDGYWRHGSVCEDYGRIRCAVYAVGGWADAYTNAIPRLLSHLPGPKKGLVGPWAHVYPHTGVPGPAIGFLQEALRWWDQWLGGVENGIMEEPLYRVWMQHSLEDGDHDRDRPGRWVAETEWPSSRIHPETYYLARGALVGRSSDLADSDSFAIHSPQTTGLDAGVWCPFGDEEEMAREQSQDDAKSVTFDSPPLRDACEILGPVHVGLRLSSDRPVAMVAARINDVAPDGSSTRVAYGLLNLTHREGHEHPSPLEPGRVYAVGVRLNDVAHRFARGHRIRLALSSSYWPIAWPAPEPVVLSVHALGSYVELPFRDPHPEDGRLDPFGPPESGPEAETVDLHVHETLRAVTRDPETGSTVTTLTSGFRDDGDPAMTRIVPLDLEIGHGIREQFRIAADDPLSARGEVRHVVVSRRNDWRIRVETTVRLESTRDRFRLRAELDAFESDSPRFSRTWDVTVPRDLI